MDHMYDLMIIYPNIIGILSVLSTLFICHDFNLYFIILFTMIPIPREKNGLCVVRVTTSILNKILDRIIPPKELRCTL